MKLIARDAGDIQVIAVQLQDAVARVGDMAYLAQERRFAFLLDRFCWEAATQMKDTESFERTRSGLHFDSVLSVRFRDFPRHDPNAVLELLTILFHEGEAPGGEIRLIFAGGACVSLEAECIEACLQDVGESWNTKHLPRHPLDETV